jgi:hypothetical protein
MSPGSPPFRIPERVLSRKLDDEMVLLNLDSGEYFGLNDTGTRVWELLADGRTGEEVTDRLTEEFEVTAEAAAAHVASLCEELVAAGLLVKAEEAVGR